MARNFIHNNQRLPCARIGCSKIGSKLCSACGRVDYCSVECQKADWCTHKKYCSKQMGRLLSLFSGCQDTIQIFECLDTAEDYLSRDPELALRLRVSNSFMDGVLELQKSLQYIPSKDRETARVLGEKLTRIQGRVREAVKSGRLCSDSKDYSFSEGVADFIDTSFVIEAPLDHWNRDEGLAEKELRESRRIANSLGDDEGAHEYFLLKQSDDYAEAGDFKKALLAAEQAYQSQSERVSPDNMLLQCITLQLCALLAKMGEHGRMLEYIHVALNNLKSTSIATNTTDSKYPDKRRYMLHKAAAALFVSGRSLPADSAERSEIFVEAFKMAAESMKSRIEFALTSDDASTADNELINTTLFDGSIPPGDVEFDYKLLLDLLMESYDTYLSGKNFRALYNTAKDITTILYHFLRRFLDNNIVSSSVDWEFLLYIMQRLDDLLQSIPSTLATTDQVRLEILAADRARDSERVSKLKTVLVIAGIRDLLKAHASMHVALQSYHPDFVGERVVISDNNFRINGKIVHRDNSKEGK